MIDEDILKLIRVLIRQTRDGKLNWTKTSRKTEFQGDFKSGMITVDSWVNEEDPFEPESAEGQYVDLAVYNSNGDRTDRLCFERREGQDYNVVLELYNVVHRRYVRADETIKSLLSELEDDEIPF